MTVARAAELQGRIERLQAGLRRRGLDGMLVITRPNAFYLTGFQSSFSHVWVTPREAVLLIDGRYIEAARATVRHCDVRLMKVPDKGLARLLREFRPRRAGFEGDAPWSAVKKWGEVRPETEWEECGGLIHRARLVKSKWEIEQIARAAGLTDEIYARLAAAVTPGVTERELRSFIQTEADRLGADGLAFESIVAAGAASSRPHYLPQRRALRCGELLLVDMGVMVDGYCSDMTRTVGLGKAPRARLARAYEAVVEAQKAALEAVGPGAGCAELYEVARGRLRRHKLDRYFPHGLGHGVGIEIHEPPRLDAQSAERLRPGMVVTIEPGVYFPGLGGVRIEDLVVVTRTGHRVLSRTPKAFRLLPFEE